MRMRPAYRLLPLLALIASTALSAQQPADCNSCNCVFVNGPLTGNNLVGTLAAHDLMFTTAGSTNTWTGAFNNRWQRLFMVQGNRYELSVCGNSLDTRIFITNSTGLLTYDCDDDGCGSPNGPSNITFTPPMNHAYRIYVFSSGCNDYIPGGVEFTVTRIAPAPLPVNDEPCGAIPLPLNADCQYTITSSTSASFSNPTGAGLPGDCIHTMQNDVWYSTTVPASGLLGIATESTGLCAGAFALYTAPDCSGTFTQFANSCTMAGTTGPTSEPARVFDVSSLPVGSTVYIRFWERNGNENGPFQICAYEAQRPVNDEPCGAVELPVTVGCTFTTFTNAVASPLSTVTATPDPVTAGCGGPATNDLWYRVTVTPDMVANGFTVNTSAGSLNDLAMAWYRLTGGSACGPGTMTQVACNNNQSAGNLMPRINSDPAVPLTAGETIYIRVWNTQPWEGTFGICATVNQPPPNNLPCNAIPITANYGCAMATFSNENATGTTHPFAGGGFATGNAQPGCQANWFSDVWFTVQMPPNGTIELDTQVGSMINGGMALYSATGSCGSGNLNLTQVACANNGSQQGTPSAQMPYLSYTNLALAGQTLYIRVWRQGPANPNGNFGLCARRTDPPPGNCFYTLTLTDAVGDGWNGSSVTVCVAGNCNTYTVTGANTTVNIGANVGDLLTMSYTSVGGFQEQNAFSLSQFGGQLYASPSPPNTGLVFAEVVDCQPPPAPQSDCIGSFSLCQQDILVNQSPTNGIGNVPDLTTANRGCLITNERRGLWYTFTTQCAGNVAFTITPIGFFGNFDFAVWGPMNQLTCPPQGPPIRCSAAFGLGATGLSINPSLPTSQGVFGSGFVRHLTVQAGDVYILYVDNWLDNFAQSGAQFNISWSASNTVCPIDPVNNPNGDIVGCMVLPLQLLSFDARPQGGQVQVEWRTAVEQDISHFVVERSRDGEHFLPMQQVAARGAGHTSNHYSWLDEAPFEGVTYYRLLQLDQRGNGVYSNVVAVDRDRPHGMGLHVYPNPADDVLRVAYQHHHEGTVHWRIWEASGRMVRQGTHAAMPGRNLMDLGVQALEPGTYVVELRNEQGGPLGHARFVKR